MGKQKTTKKKVKKETKLLTKKEWLAKFFGKFTEFGDGVEYQRKMRSSNG
jgi:hypothetical protein